MGSDTCQPDKSLSPKSSPKVMGGRVRVWVGIRVGQSKWRCGLLGLAQHRLSPPSTKTVMLAIWCCRSQLLQVCKGGLVARGWVSYVGEGAFFTVLSGKGPGFLTSL